MKGLDFQMEPCMNVIQIQNVHVAPIMDGVEAMLIIVRVINVLISGHISITPKLIKTLQLIKMSIIIKGVPKQLS